MRPIVLDAIEEKVPGEQERLEPGAYPCRITSVTDVPDKEYLIVLVDIVAGKHADYFSDPFYKDKDFAHRLYLTYKQDNLGMFKHNLHVITDCNPGFDAEAAIAGGNEKALENKAVGIVFREEEYWDKKVGEWAMGSARPDRMVRLTEMEEERNKSPKPRMLRDDEKRRALERAGLSAFQISQAMGQGGPAQAAAPAWQPSQAPAAAPDAYDGELPF